MEIRRVRTCSKIQVTNMRRGPTLRSTVLSGMRVSGSSAPISEKEEVPRFGQMVQDMMDTGFKIRLTGREDFSMLMAICTQESGKMTSQTALESTCTLMEQSMREPGRKTSIMAMERNHGLMELSTLVTT